MTKKGFTLVEIISVLAITGIIGLGAAIEWLSGLDRHALAAHEAQLRDALDGVLARFSEVHQVGTAANRTAIASFVVDGAHPSDVGTLLDQQGIAVRAGHHCTMPLMDRLGLPGNVRASCSFYNTLEEVERFAAGLGKVLRFL